MKTPIRTALLLIVAHFLQTAALAAGSLAVGNLSCEFRINPPGIGELAPRLGWRLTAVDSAAHDLKQSAYRIIVATTEAAAARGEGNVWDSGRIASDDTQNVVYEGKPLLSGGDYFWQVMVWDRNNQLSAAIPPAHWSMGLLTPAEWSAEWIGLNAKALIAEPPAIADQRSYSAAIPWLRIPPDAAAKGSSTAWFRRGFTLPAGRTLVGVTMFCTADQVCRLSINGQAAHTFVRWAPAEPVDLISFFQKGDNCVGLCVTQGDGGFPAVLGDLEFHFADGSFFRLPIDPSWHYFNPAKGDPARPPSGWDLAVPASDPWREAVQIADRRSPWGTPQDAFLVLPPAPFLRKEFTLSRPVKKAILYATALGVYEPWLNGHKVGHDSLTPGWTDYRFRVDRQAYDVTGHVAVGRNALGAILGEGWYSGTFAYKGQKENYGSEPRFAAQLQVTYADGTSETIRSDGTWRANVGPIRYADLLQGYSEDRRLAWNGWANAGFDDRAWHPVETGLPSPGAVYPGSDSHPVVQSATIDPVCVSDEVAAVKTTPVADGRLIVDFGQDLVGWVRLVVRGKAGQQVQLRHGEMLNADGTLYTANLRSAAATDVYQLAGEPTETLEPRFTYHGFRYTEIVGVNPKDVLAATAVVIGSPLVRTGDFTSSDPRLNRLFQNIIWGQKGNYLEVPTDCPQRDERLGWTGDTGFFIRTATYNFNVVSFIERWLVTMATDEQGQDGTFPDVAPTLDRPSRAGTAWGDAALTCGYELWRTYGDTRVLEKHFDQFSRYMDWMETNADHNIASVGGYGDWLNKGGGAKKEVIDTAYYANLAEQMADMATAIHRDAAAKHYRKLHDTVLKAFQQRFVSAGGSILDSDQTGFALAFSMNLLPDSARKAAADRFLATIASRDWHLATGFIGTPRLLPALSKAGLDTVAYRLLLQDTYPSWLFQVKNGATTMWERWDGWTPQSGFQTTEMNSFNHYAFGAVGEFLYRFVGGIDTLGAGFRVITLKPIVGPGLDSAQATFAAPTGDIMSSWRKTHDAVEYDFIVPPNVTATILLPTMKPTEVGSGKYQFTLPAAAAFDLQHP